MKSLVRILRYLKPYRLIITGSLLALAVSIVCDLALPRLIQTIIDQGINARDLAAILRISGIMIGITAVSAVGAVLNMSLAIRISQHVGADIRRDLFAKIQTLSYSDLDRLQTGNLITRLTSDNAQVTQFVMQTMRLFVRAPLMLVGSVILLIMTNWQLALLMLIVVPTAVCILVIYARKAQPQFLKVQQRMDRLNTLMQENISGVRLVKAFARETFENGRFDAANSGVMTQATRVGRLLALIMPLMRLLVNLAILVVIWYGGSLAIGGHLTLGQIVAFNNYIWSIMMPINLLGMAVGSISAADASAQRILEVLDTQPAIANPPAPVVIPEAPAHVVLEDVSFRYDGAEQPDVLSGIDLDIQPGETVAILGATGSGKSTLVNLLPRYYDVDSGRVAINGIDVRDADLDAVRGSYGIVPQDTILFSLSIRDNIRYGRPDALDEEVIAAAQVAQAHDFIMDLPNGYDTLLSERGVNLSGGQKQRLAIARAVLMRPEVLLLDDCISAVDLETASKILDNLDETLQGRTRVVVAQRISTALNADRIVVMDNGRIAASGTHSDLMAESELYREIYHSQLGTEDEGGNGGER
ncbi:MAG: ABC transporter ATP-binding protein/permease [Chloroflexi bacterium]|nr:ABC transporter ATP-binding protein/permease [Chloroflexota bacterium]